MKSGESYRGELAEAEDNWNCQLKNVRATARVSPTLTEGAAKLENMSGMCAWDYTVERGRISMPEKTGIREDRVAALGKCPLAPIVSTHQWSFTITSPTLPVFCLAGWEGLPLGACVHQRRPHQVCSPYCLFSHC